MQSQALQLGVNDGIFAIAKPKGISSYDVIRRIKKLYTNTKIGHGGTLDPLASGVLVIAVGSKFTKQLHTILHNVNKTYVAHIKLGATSSTDDGEGPIELTQDPKIPTRQEVESILSQFIGKTTQVPPQYSAVKLQGTPAYKRARAGERVLIAPKQIQIDSINLDKYEYPDIICTVECASGVYIRSLARDVGQRLGIGAYLQELSRTRVGNFSLSEALNI